MSDPLRFDFGTNAWVRDDFLAGRGAELPAPAVPPAEGQWTRPAPPSRASWRNVGLLALLLAAPLVGFAWDGLAGLSVALFFDVLGLIVVRNLPERPSHLPAAPEDLRLMEQSDDFDVCLVEVEIAFDGRPVGKDRGVAWFEGGALLFSGRRTSFAVGGEDVLPKSYWGEYGRERAGALPPDAVPLCAIRPRTYLLLTPLEREERVSREQGKRFRERRREFRERPAASAGVPRQWPPFAP